MGISTSKGVSPKETASEKDAGRAHVVASGFGPGAADASQSTGRRTSLQGFSSPIKPMSLGNKVSPMPGRGGGGSGSGRSDGLNPVDLIRAQAGGGASGPSAASTSSQQRPYLGSPPRAPVGGVTAVGARAAAGAGGSLTKLGPNATAQQMGAAIIAAGGKVFTPTNVSSLLPSASSLPVAIVVLDAAPDDREHSGAGVGPSDRCRLVPAFINPSLRGDYGVSQAGDYAGVLRKMLKRDPKLSFALQKAVRHLRQGDPQQVNHVTPDPSGASFTLSGIRLTPVVWKDPKGWRGSSVGGAAGGGAVLPALLLEHNLPYDADVIVPHLMRDYAVLSHVPAILTLIDFQGKVLYQNAASLEYIGDLLNASYTAELAGGLLSLLFQYDDDSLEAMLVQLLDGNQWQGVVMVPSCLQRQLSSQTTPYNPDALGIEIVAAAGTSGAGGSHLPHPDDELLLAPRRGSSSVTVDAGMGPGYRERKLLSLLEARSSPNDGQSARVSGTDRASGGRGGAGPSPNVRGGRPPSRGASGGGRSAGSECGSVDASEWDESDSYHEVHAIPLLDPVLDKQVIMLVQTDVTPRVELENKLADLTDAQLSMLEQLFPRHIIEYMLARVHPLVGKNLRELANTHDQVMVLFCDVVGFTSMSKEVQAQEVMNFLNKLYEAFDGLVDDYGMYKLDIVGDCYIVVAGLIKEDQDGFVCVDELDEDQVAANAVRIMQFAKAMLREAGPVLMPHDQTPVCLRIGIHIGPLVSGLVGSKMPKFTLFGDTMNTASRMESTCKKGSVHVSADFAALLPKEAWESTGGVEVKGKGRMDTFLWTPSEADKKIPLKGSGSNGFSGSAPGSGHSMPVAKRGHSFSVQKHATMGRNPGRQGLHRSASRAGRNESGENEISDSALLSILSTLAGGGSGHRESGGTNRGDSVASG